MSGKKSNVNSTAMTEQEAREAVIIVRDERIAQKRPPSKAWSKGGREYNKVLGHFGPSVARSK